MFFSGLMNYSLKKRFALNIYLFQTRRNNEWKWRRVWKSWALVQLCSSTVNSVCLFVHSLCLNTAHFGILIELTLEWSVCKDNSMFSVNILENWQYQLFIIRVLVFCIVCLVLTTWCISNALIQLLQQHCFSNNGKKLKICFFLDRRNHQ